MGTNGNWLLELNHATVATATVEGLIPVAGYDRSGKRPEEVAVMEKAASYDAQAVFFEAGRNGRAPVPQAFIFIS